MSAPVNNLDKRTQDSGELLADIMPSAITLAMMLRHKKMAAWLRTELDGYQDHHAALPYRRNLPGHIVAKSPQYGWIPAPVSEQQTQEFAHLDLIEGINALERICVNSKKGNGNRILLNEDDMEILQKHINLNAELAINLSRDVYSRLLRTVRGAIYLWTQELMRKGLAGEHNHYSPDVRALVKDLDIPEYFWRKAMDKVDSLPIPEAHSAGFFERMFGRVG